MSQQSLFVTSSDLAGAVFDESRTYRYLLWRRWGEGPGVLWIMLNPSTADEHVLDPTLRRCLDYTKRWGFGEMVVANLYALRSTDPKELWRVDDPVGPDNLHHIEKAVRDSGRVIVGWGSNAKPDAVAAVVEIFQRLEVQPYCLRLSPKTGQPWHPLYLPKSSAPIPWSPRV